VDGRSCRVRVQGTEGQVAGFRDTQRRLDCFQVAHFADQYHIWIFTKRSAQCIAEALRVGVQLALVDHAILVHVYEFDRIFNGQNVVMALAIDLVDHGGKRRGLARSSWSSDQHESAWLVAKLTDDRRQTKLVKILDLERNDAEHGRRRAALIEYVRAET